MQEGVTKPVQLAVTCLAQDSTLVLQSFSHSFLGSREEHRLRQPQYHTIRTQAWTKGGKREPLDGHCEKLSVGILLPLTKRSRTIIALYITRERGNKSSLTFIHTVHSFYLDHLSNLLQCFNYNLHFCQFYCFLKLV